MPLLRQACYHTTGNWLTLLLCVRKVLKTIERSPCLTNIGDVQSVLNDSETAACSVFDYKRGLHSGAIWLPERKILSFSIIIFVSRLVRERKKGLTTDVVLLDLSKAFDSVPHECLWTKIHAYGIQGTLLSWLRRFLTI